MFALFTPSHPLGILNNLEFRVFVNYLFLHHLSYQFQLFDLSVQDSVGLSETLFIFVVTEFVLLMIGHLITNTCMTTECRS